MMQIRKGRRPSTEKKRKAKSKQTRQRAKAVKSNDRFSRRFNHQPSTPKTDDSDWAMFVRGASIDARQQLCNKNYIDCPISNQMIERLICMYVSFIKNNTIHTKYIHKKKMNKVLYRNKILKIEQC